MSSPDAAWIAEVLSQLRSPDTLLVRELLEHLAKLEEQSAAAASPRQGKGQHTDQEKRRAALYNRLRDHWNKVKHYPPCLMQCQVLKEVSILSTGPLLLLKDPLEEGTELDVAKGRRYGHRALEIAESLGAQNEIGEISVILAEHCMLISEHEQARRYCDRALEIGAAIGNINVVETAHKHKDELLTLVGSPEEVITHREERVKVDQKYGNIYHQFFVLSDLARLLTLSGNVGKAAEKYEALEKLKPLLDDPCKDRNIAHHYGFNSLVPFKLGDLDKAVEIQQEAISANVKNPACREDFLWSDLAWLEKLYRLKGEERGFAAFCETLRDGHSRIEQWHLVADVPGRIAWDEEVYFESFPEGWEWVDPLGKGTYKLEKGFELAPIVGTGVLTNVYIPRLMRQVEGDFVIEAVLDFEGSLAKAGGILIYQDDNTLLRFSCGALFDGEISLAVKSPELGLYVPGRGLLEEQRLVLRVERRGNAFGAWCGSGRDWFKCAEAEVGMQEKIQVGIFAECTYRTLRVERCMAVPVKFRAVKISGSTPT